MTKKVMNCPICVRRFAGACERDKYPYRAIEYDANPVIKERIPTPRTLRILVARREDLELAVEMFCWGLATLWIRMLFCPTTLPAT